MPSPSYHQSLWEGVPEGLAPADADLREAFLLGLLTVETAHAGRALRILDLGCGEGHFAAILAAQGAEVVAVDVAEEPLRRARVSHPDLDLQLVEAEGRLPFEDSSFDMVWAGETIEHVADTSGWLSELRRVLRSGGIVALTTPNHGRLRRLWPALSEDAFQAHFDPRSDHLRFYTRRALARLLADFGFGDVTVDLAGGVPCARRVLLASGRRKRF
jgi:ubiquinone/menaquinone biosynthesis C-methylase UbiE